MTPASLLGSWVIGAVILMSLLFIVGTILRSRRTSRVTHYKRLPDISFTSHLACGVGLVVGTAFGLLVTVPSRHLQWFLAWPALGMILAMIVVVAGHWFFLGGTHGDDAFLIEQRKEPWAYLRSLLPWKILTLSAVGLIVIIYLSVWASGQASPGQRSRTTSWNDDGIFGWGIREPFVGSFYTTCLAVVLPMLAIVTISAIFVAVKRPAYLPLPKYRAIDRGFRRQTIRIISLMWLLAVMLTLAMIAGDIAWVFGSLGHGSTEETRTALFTTIVTILALVLALWSIVSIFFLPRIEEDHHLLPEGIEQGFTSTAELERLRLQRLREARIAAFAQATEETREEEPEDEHAEEGEGASAQESAADVGEDSVEIEESEGEDETAQGGEGETPEEQDTVAEEAQPEDTEAEEPHDEDTEVQDDESETTDEENTEVEEPEPEDTESEMSEAENTEAENTEAEVHEIEDTGKEDSAVEGVQPEDTETEESHVDIVTHEEDDYTPDRFDRLMDYVEAQAAKARDAAIQGVKNAGKWLVAFMHKPISTDTPGVFDVVETSSRKVLEKWFPPELVLDPRFAPAPEERIIDATDEEAWQGWVIAQPAPPAPPAPPPPPPPPPAQEEKVEVEVTPEEEVEEVVDEDVVDDSDGGNTVEEIVEIEEEIPEESEEEARTQEETPSEGSTKPENKVEDKVEETPKKPAPRKPAAKTPTTKQPASTKTPAKPTTKPAIEKPTPAKTTSSKTASAKTPAKKTDGSRKRSARTAQPAAKKTPPPTTNTFRTKKKGSK